jgi:hypothetical protein
MKTFVAQDGVQQLIMSKWPGQLYDSYANIVSSCCNFPGDQWSCALFVSGDLPKVENQMLTA